MDGAYLRLVDGFHRHQNPHLRRDGQHVYDAAKARINSASWLVAMVFRSSRSFPPLTDSTSSTQLVAVPVLAVSSSTKAGAALPSSGPRPRLFGGCVEARGSHRSVPFCGLGRSTPSTRAELHSAPRSCSAKCLFQGLGAGGIYGHALHFPSTPERSQPQPEAIHVQIHHGSRVQG